MNDQDVSFATAGGIYRFCGDRWEFMQVSDVLTLARQDGNLWLGTSSGLRCVGPNGTIGRSAGVWPKEPVSALAATADGIWAAIGETVGFVTEGDWSPIDVGWIGTRVTGLVPLGERQVWIASHHGLFYSESGDVIQQETDSPPDLVARGYRQGGPDNFSNQVQGLAVQQFEGVTAVWIGTARGLFRVDFPGERWRSFVQPGLGDVQALVCCSTSMELWVASWEGGLRRFRNSVDLGGVADPLAISALEVGAGGRCWAAVAWSTASDGQLAGGIYLNDGAVWSLVLSAAKLRTAGLAEGARVHTLVEDLDGSLWIGSSAGLLAYDTRMETVEAVDIPICKVSALSVLPSLDALGVGTSRGLYLVRPDGWTHLGVLNDYQITALAWDGDADVLWVGTDHGLIQLGYDAGSWRLCELWDIRNSGLGADRVTALAARQSRGGVTHVWVGTANGLCEYCCR